MGTTEPGSECPECARRFAGETCVCGWTASKPAGPTTRCAVCATPTRQVQLVQADREMGGDGLERCALCHVDYLRRCAQGTTDATACSELACDQTVGEHRQAFRILLDQIEQRMTTRHHPADAEPGKLERLGTPGHPWPRQRLRGHA